MIYLYLIFFLLVTAFIALLITDKLYIFRGIKVVYLKGYLSAYIDDWPQFDNAVIYADHQNNAAQKWKLSKNYNTLKPTDKLKKTHKRMGTVAFLIIKNNEILYENYAKGYGTTSKTNSYSMAKSITVALLGKAIEEKYIRGLHQPVGDFFPSFDRRLTIGDLASMASGMEWNEDYDNPFSSVAQLYLEKDLRQWMLTRKIVEKPGLKFDYNSGNTQLLGMIIEKATGRKVSDYLSEKFWKPLGMQEDALWEYDSAQTAMEKTYCCIASNARDFARFGRLFTQKGRWNETQLLNPDFVEKCLTPRFPENPEYGYGFWLSHYRNKNIFLMQGILGQYVISIPEDDLIIVRLGKKRDRFKDNKPFTEDFYVYVDEVYNMMHQ